MMMTNSRQQKSGTSKVSPIEIMDLVHNIDHDDEEEISLVYPAAAAQTSMTIARNKGTNVENAISVEKYSEDKDLHLAIIASLLPTQEASPHGRQKVIDLSLSEDDDDDDVQVLDYFDEVSSPPSSSRKRKRKPLFTFRGTGTGTEERVESSKTIINTFLCEICVEERPCSQSFEMMGCHHSYCSDCMIKYVTSKLEDSITQIQCPVSGCIGLLEPDHCRSILPHEVFDRWGTALCEAVILASDKFYCPFKDCSALLIDDQGGLQSKAITQSECPNCIRLFCAQCKVPWHPGIECSEFQKLNNDEREREDIMLMQLAKNQRWMRCPKCKFYVEKSEGCLFMRCRCGHAFCYNCGNPLKNHYCTKLSYPIFSFHFPR